MTVVQLCIWFKEEPSQLFMGQTAHSLTCSTMKKPHTGLDECPRILLSCYTAGNSVGHPPGVRRKGFLAKVGGECSYKSNVCPSLSPISTLPSLSFLFPLLGHFSSFSENGQYSKLNAHSTEEGAGSKEMSKC